MGWPLDSSGVTYGTTAGVQRYVNAFTLNSSSEPSASAVDIRLKEESALIDAELTGDGWALPVTDTMTVYLLTAVSERRAAANVYQVLALGQGIPPNAAVDMLLDEAQSIMTKLLENANLTEAPDIGVPGVSGAGAVTAFPRYVSDDFAYDYGQQ